MAANQSPPPLGGTFISSVADRNVLDVIHVFYQDEQGGLVRDRHRDKDPANVPTDRQTVLRLHSPLGSVFTLAQSSPNPGVELYAQGPDYEIFQKIPTYRRITEAAGISKLGAMYDGNSTYVLYQKAGEGLENKIFEKKLRTESENAVIDNAYPGTNLSVYEPAIHPGPPSLSPRAMAYKLKGRDPPTDVDGTCRYMVYNGTDKHLWWVWIDYPSGPDIERVQNIQTQHIKPNTPVAIICLLDLFALYYINHEDKICRIFRGDYGWGLPKLVEGLPVNPRIGTNLAVSRDLSQGERVVWLSYQGEDGAITGVHDTIRS